MEGGVADFTAIVGQQLVERGVDDKHIAGAAAADDHGPITVTIWKLRISTAYNRIGPISCNPDLVNIQYQTAAYGMHPAINLLPRLPRVPTVVTFMTCACRTCCPRQTPAQMGQCRPGTQADAVIVTNAQDRAELEQLGGIKRLETIPGSNIVPSP